jgi:hypothetical protein
MAKAGRPGAICTCTSTGPRLDAFEGDGGDMLNHCPAPCAHNRIQSSVAPGAGVVPPFGIGPIKKSPSGFAGAALSRRER